MDEIDFTDREWRRYNRFQRGEVGISGTGSTTEVLAFFATQPGEYASLEPAEQQAIHDLLKTPSELRRETRKSPVEVPNLAEIDEIPYESP